MTKRAPFRIESRGCPRAGKNMLAIALPLRDWHETQSPVHHVWPAFVGGGSPPNIKRFDGGDAENVHLHHMADSLVRRLPSSLLGEEASEGTQY